MDHCMRFHFLIFWFLASDVMGIQSNPKTIQSLDMSCHSGHNGRTTWTGDGVASTSCSKERPGVCYNKCLLRHVYVLDDNTETLVPKEKMVDMIRRNFFNNNFYSKSPSNIANKVYKHCKLKYEIGQKDKQNCSKWEAFTQCVGDVLVSVSI